jgi:hypothetical protein
MNERKGLNEIIAAMRSGAELRVERRRLRSELEQARTRLTNGTKHLPRIRKLIEHHDQYTYKQWQTTQATLEWTAARCCEIAERMAELGPPQVLEEPPRGREKHYRRTGRTIDAEYVEPPTIFDGFTFEERRA